MDLSDRTPPFSTAYVAKTVATGLGVETDRLFGVGSFIARAIPGERLNRISDWVAEPRIVRGDALGAAL